jgi:hypothetical protein
MSYNRFSSQIFNASTTWICPQNVTTIILQGFGGGGGGGSGDSGNGGGGGGGGGSLQSSVIVTVVPGTVYAITIGTGGAGGAASGPGANGNNGGVGLDTTFAALATFQGASGGGGSQGSAPDQGGQCTKGIGGINIYTAVSATAAAPTNSTSLGFFASTASGGTSTLTSSPGSLNPVGGFASGAAGAQGSGGNGGGGGGAGPGGAGTAGTNAISGTSTNATNAAANSGAGGGGSGCDASGSGSSGNGGNGGSGQLIIFGGGADQIQTSITPPQIPGLIMWLRADMGIPGASNGSKFSTWNDQSPIGLVFSQSTSANQFVWNSSDASFGGKPSITSVAASAMRSTTQITQNQPFTMYYVFYTTSPSTEQFLLSNSVLQHILYVSQYYNYCGAALQAGATDTNPHVICMIVNGTSSAIYVDNSQAAIITGTAGTSNFISEYLYLGFTGVTTFNLIGNQAEQIMYLGSHTTAQRAQIFNYLARRYALSAG